MFRGLRPQPQPSPGPSFAPMPLHPLHLRTFVVTCLVVVPMALGGCATREPVEAKPAAAAVEDQPEPLPKGMKPLTVEQGEMIQQ